MVERSIDCSHDRVSHARTGLAPDVPDGPANVVEGQLSPRTASAARRNLGAVGRLAGAIARLDQVSFAVEVAAVPMMPARRHVH